MRHDDPFYQTPPDVKDPVVEAYKADIDRTMLIENLKLTTQQRSEKFERAMALVFELRKSALNKRKATQQ